MLLSNSTDKVSLMAAVILLLSLLLVASEAASRRSQEILDCTTGEDAAKLCRNRNGATSTQKLAGKGRRQVESEVCATSLAQDGQPLLICSTTSQLSTSMEEGGEVKVSIRTPNNRTQFELSSSPTIECRAIASLKLGQDYELSKFKLRWLHNNRTIAMNVAAGDSSTTIIGPSAARIWTVARDSGLDLEINDFRSSDSGNYTCQALTAKTSAVLDEDVIKLEANLEDSDTRGEQQEEEAAVAASMKLYSRSNLANLLPTLRVVPDFTEIALGDSLQLACVTSGLDPEPEPSELEWSFEWMPGNRELLLDVAPEAMGQLPVNITVMGGGNLLTIWWASADHVGLYRCRHHLDQFNLTSEAVGEIAMRPSGDSAPLVFLQPELIRLSVNGSTRIQCEATGYPRPTITWYRVEEDSSTGGKLPASDTTITANNDNEVEFEEIEPRDTSIYCRRNKCSAPTSSKVTGVSIVHLHRVRAQHQGQWVCRADNKHGSNQASALVDVEFREAPRVRLVPESRQQTILLSTQQGEQNDPTAEVATFRCLVEAGRPRPKLRWLRVAAGAGAGGSGSDPSWAPDNLDLYDLTQMSSATSNVSTRLISKGNNQQELVLEVRTVSPEDEGAYVCVAENEWGRHSALAHLDVRRPGQVRIAQKSPWLAKPNDTFQLDCLVSGHPKPIDIEWSRPDRGAFFALISRGLMSQQQQPQPANTYAADRAVLKFDRVGVDDSGEYECLAREPMNSSLVLRDTIMVVVEGESEPTNSIQEQEQRLPRLVVSPTKATIKPGANLTLDCLAIGGLQPTLVEWQAPHVVAWHHHSNVSLNMSSSMSSELDIWPYYRSRPHQSTSRLVQLGSKLRIMNAGKQHEGVYQCKGRNRAGVEVAPALVKLAEFGSGEKPHQQEEQNSNQTPAKTKVASLGSNIELKCQVSGVEEQPATSWSRDGQELPTSSLQIGHNLWIQNVSHQDGGLYVCSARSEQPDKIIQAKINLQVRASTGLAQSRMLKPLKGRIVASKSQVNVGDSITLECIVSSSSNGQDKSNQFINLTELNAMELEELERQVVWTNLHSGQSVFQDNVYVSNNLLVIYNLRSENSATYRCNYNELTQSIDYKLQVESFSSPLSALNTTEEDLRNLHNFTEQQQEHQVKMRQVSLGTKVELECAGSVQSISNIYYWTRNSELRQRVGQANKSLTFDPIKNHEADLYQCHAYNNVTGKTNLVISVLVQVLVPGARFLQKPVSFITLPAISGADQQLELELVMFPERDKGLILFSGSPNQSGDYISLGLNKGYLEFKFELGDGLTRLRSLQPLQLNQWHRALIERNRRGAVMWVDKEPAVSNSSAGKFFNLNLDSVLYVGGHQHFLNTTAKRSSFHGHQRGFQGCISMLRIGRRQVELMARNRSVSMGVYECDKPECSSDTALGAHHCSAPNGVCQVDSNFSSTMPGDRLRCICLPGFGGRHCERPLGLGDIIGGESINRQPPIVVAQSSSQALGACELLTQPPCSQTGTQSCQSLSKSSFRCHCKLGHMGDTCQEVAQFPAGNDTSVWFNQLAYLHLRLNKPDDVIAAAVSNTSIEQRELANKLAKLGSMAESQSISFRLRTNSSYGLIFYLGHTWSELNESSSSVNLHQSQVQANQGGQVTGVQTSKSMVANLLARLFTTVTDYLAIALVDGHVELSYELGSGVAILRSSRRVNDSQPHRIQVLRQGKLAKLIIDELHKHEGSSPGKLSMLNVPGDVYLGGLPHLAELTHNMYMSGFIGCVSQLQLNSLGPLNLIQSDQLAQVRSARNLAPCHLNSPGSSILVQTTLELEQKPASITSVTTIAKPPQTHRPWKATAEPSEDPDEM